MLTELHVEPFGRVLVTFRRGMRTFRAHWSGDTLKVSVPPSPIERVKEVLAANAPQIMRLRPASPALPGPGTRLQFGELTIDIAEGPKGQMVKGVKQRGGGYLVTVPEGSDTTGPEWGGALEIVIMKILYREASPVLLPQARAIAERVGVSPAVWKIARGRRVLGTCTPRREIRLSCALLMLPPELREYIICHELAHLTHMNHSQQFHALCNAYLGGREKEMIRALKAFNWPVPRW